MNKGLVLALALAATIAGAVIVLDLDDLSDVVPRDQSTSDPSVTTTTSPKKNNEPDHTDSLLYIRERTVARADLESGEQETVFQAPTPNVYAANGSRWIAYVDIEGPFDPHADFLDDPVLIARDLETGRELTAGPGPAALWDGAGRRFAYLRPSPDQVCSAETCDGGAELVVFDTETGENRRLLEASTWGLLAWAGDHLLLSEAESSRTTVVSPRGERSTLPFAPSEIWDASPDGDWLIVVRASRPSFVPLGNGSVAGEPIEIPLDDRDMLASAWSHDGTEVAAIVTGEAGLQSDPADYEVVTFSPENPDPSPVPGTTGAAGQVLWGPDNSSVVFARTQGAARLQARTCPTDGGKCVDLFTWSEGVVFLRVE